MPRGPPSRRARAARWRLLVEVLVGDLEFRQLLGEPGVRATRADLFLDGQKRGEVSYTIQINRVNGSMEYHFVLGPDHQDFYGHCQKIPLIPPSSTRF